MIQKEVSVKPFVPKGHLSLSEISQTKAVKFSFLVKDEENPAGFKAFHPLVKCRDFLNDVVNYFPLQQSIDVYGFKLHADENILDKKKTRLLIVMPNEQRADLFIHNFPAIMRTEQEFFDRDSLKLFSVQGSASRVVLEASPFWQQSTQLFSWLTLMCRLSLYLESPNQSWWELKIPSGNDADALDVLKQNNGQKQIPLLKHLEFEDSPSPSGFAPTVDLYNVHDCSGILSFCERDGQSYGNFFMDQMDKLLKKAA